MGKKNDQMKKKDKVMRRRSILNDEDIKKVYF
jgi:hypothetical protein